MSKRCITYGYLVPACRQSPFLILPAAYYNGEGLPYLAALSRLEAYRNSDTNTD